MNVYGPRQAGPLQILYLPDEETASEKNIPGFPESQAQDENVCAGAERSSVGETFQVMYQDGLGLSFVAPEPGNGQRIELPHTVLGSQSRQMMQL